MEQKREEPGKRLAEFCTCTDLACPNHPSNHGEGCARCIRKCLTLREIPSCFFHSVGTGKPTRDWFYEDFSELVRKASGSRGFQFFREAGGIRIRVSGEWAGEDLSLSVSGGDRPHIGCAALAVPDRPGGNPGSGHAAVSVITEPGHRDDALAVPIARKLACILGCRVSVSCGVHTDGIAPEQIRQVLDLADPIAEEAAERAGKVRPGS
jgi:hypothetical protein